MSTPITALIVDDEPLGRRGIRACLSRQPDIVVVGDAANGREAVQAIRDLAPMLVFLDVQMPGLDGFGVVEAVGPDAMPVTIFVTAYDEHALRAFRAHALDYLLKPIDDDRFDDAVARAIRRIRSEEESALGRRLRALVQGAPTVDAEQEVHSVKERFAVKTGGRIRFVAAADVDAVEAAGDYVVLRTRRDEHLLRATMASMADGLGPDFVRLHRSTIVRASRVRELLPYGSNAYVAVLDDGTRHKVSRSYRAAVLSYFDADA